MPEDACDPEAPTQAAQPVCRMRPRFLLRESQPSHFNSSSFSNAVHLCLTWAFHAKGTDTNILSRKFRVIDIFNFESRTHINHESLHTRLRRRLLNKK